MKKLLLLIIGGIIVLVEGENGFVFGVKVDELLIYVLKFDNDYMMEIYLLMNIDSINM